VKVGITALLLLACACSAQTTPGNRLPFCKESSGKTEECIIPPKVKKSVDPQYPIGATPLDPKTAVVALSLTVDEKGSPGDIRVVHSLGEKFDQAAVNALKKWRFEPARMNTDGKKIAVTMGTEIRFLTALQQQAEALHVCGDKYPPPCAKTPPRAVSTEDPEYSPEALARKAQGDVELWVVVDPNGHVSAVGVQRSLGTGLDEQAIRSVRQWRFQPGKLADGTPVAVQITVEIHFEIR
jgi:TonB family protein